MDKTTVSLIPTAPALRDTLQRAWRVYWLRKELAAKRMEAAQADATLADALASMPAMRDASLARVREIGAELRSLGAEVPR